MSIPLFLTTSGATAPSSTPTNAKKLLPSNASSTSKEQIRERLNMHVKKRIQGQDIISQYPVPGSPIPSNLKLTHPFLLSGTMPLVVFANSLLTVTSDYNNTINRTVPLPQLDRQSNKSKQQPKKLTKKKKIANNKKKSKNIGVNQQAENLILNTKLSDDSNDDMASNSANGHFSPQNYSNNDDTSPNSSEKNDPKSTPDILSMVLSLKKNALMHDPYVIQCISSIR